MRCELVADLNRWDVSTYDRNCASHSIHRGVARDLRIMGFGPTAVQPEGVLFLGVRTHGGRARA